MSLEQRIYNADQARLVLENEAFAAAFGDLKQEITDKWQNSPVRDHEGREALFNLLKLANKLELILRASLDDGKLAKTELDYTMRQQARERAVGLDVSGWSSRGDQQQ